MNHATFKSCWGSPNTKWPEGFDPSEHEIIINGTRETTNDSPSNDKSDSPEIEKKSDTQSPGKTEDSEENKSLKSIPEKSSETNSSIGYRNISEIPKNTYIVG